MICVLLVLVLAFGPPREQPPPDGLSDERQPISVVPLTSHNIHAWNEPPVETARYRILYGAWASEHLAGKLTISAAVLETFPATHRQSLTIYTWECRYGVHNTSKIEQMEDFANGNNSSYLARVLCSTAKSPAITKVKDGPLVFRAGDLYFFLMNIEVLRRDIQLA